MGVETLVVIVGMALSRQSSTKTMAKEIARVQAELAEHTKNKLEDKQKSLDELKVALELRYEQEKQHLIEMHAHELEELHGKIESTVLDKREAETLKVVKYQALITNSHLRDSQLDYLSHVERLRTYQSQSKTLLVGVTRQDEVHTKAEASLQRVSHF